MKRTDPLAWLFPPSMLFDNDEERAEAQAFAQLKRRWANLEAWFTGATGGQSVPRAQWEAWQAFRARWESPLHAHDRDELRAAANDLAVAEGNAQLQGYSSPDVRALSVAERGPQGASRSPEPVSTPTLADEHPIAVGIDEAARALQNKVPPGPSADPWFAAKVGVVAAMGLGTAAGALAGSRDSTRVGVAVAGTLLTAGAAVLLFSPSTKKEPPK